MIVTASFEGLPADSAAHFVSWLENVKDAKAFADLKFAVFGCGNRDWVNTYQRVPRLVDELLGCMDWEPCDGSAFQDLWNEDDAASNYSYRPLYSSE